MNPEDRLISIHADTVNHELLEFIRRSPTAFQAAAQMARILQENDFAQLPEEENWELEPGNAYFVRRNDSSLVAFRMPAGDFGGFQLFSAHSDSPMFRIKPNAEVVAEKAYVRLNAEPYGGMILSTWLDRPLSVAGRVVVRTPQGIASKLVNIDRDLVVIPNTAAALNRRLSAGCAYNLQTDMQPLYGMADAENTFLPLIAGAAGVETEDILDTDLYLYSRVSGTVYGVNQEFIGSPRLDNLQCAFAGLQGFLAAEAGESCPVFAVYDNEEIGSRTRQGADSDFLSAVLQRICTACGYGPEAYYRCLADSFYVSVDNAHALHPNHPELYDPDHQPLLNKGIVIKYNAAQHYASDGLSAGLFRQICARAEVPWQTFVYRNDNVGGGTLGNLSNTHVSMLTVDVGLPSLSMHSAFETAGTLDTTYLMEAMQMHFSTSVHKHGRSYELQFPADL